MLRKTLFLLASSMPALAFASELAPVDKVVVFADRAEVTRTTRARCEGGRAIAAFERLAPAADERTVRGVAAAPAKAVGTTVAVVPGGPRAGAELAALRASLAGAEADLAARQDKKQALAAQLEDVGELAGLLGAIVGEAARNPAPDTNAWGAALDAITKRRIELSAATVTAEAESRKLQATIARLQRAIEQHGADDGSPGRRAEVVVDCGGQREVQVGLVYVVGGARWRPEYDVDFTPDGAADAVGPGRARLTVSAVVEQSTGEDWAGATLVLSTAKPRLGASAPIPAPLYVDGSKSSSGKVLVQAMEKRERLERGGSGGGGGPEGAALEDRGQSVVLEVPRKVTVRSDGRPYWIPIDRLTTKAVSKLVTAPKLREHVYQLVRFESPAPYPLLAGRVHAYRRGGYVGDTTIEYRGRGEPLEISLGIDERVKVVRREVSNRDQRARLFASTRRLEHHFRVELTSRSQAALAVEVRDNLPVSKIEDVEVEVDRGVTSKSFTLDAERGFVVWSTQLAPSARADIDLRYTIRLPDDWQVNLP